MVDVGRRKILVSTGAWLVPTALRAQQPSLPVIGFLNGASYALSEQLVRAFHQGLAETGFVEGRNVAFDYRSADGHYDRLPALAADLARRQVTLIAATGTPTGLPAKAATTTIPIVFVTGSDPVQQGLVADMSRPNGNMTGATTLAVEMGRKRLELVAELVHKGTLVGALVNPKGPNLEPLMHDLESAAQALGMPLHVVHASDPADFETVFPALARMKVGALVIGTDTFFNSQSKTLGELTVRHALPAVYQYREFVAAGGLMSYGGSITDAYRQVGIYAGRILKGEKPSNLPVQQSTKAELFVNLKTAKALGISLPQAILARADESIQ